MTRFLSACGGCCNPVFDVRLTPRKGGEIFSPIPGLPGWSFLRFIPGGILPPPAVPLAYARGQGFPPRINRETTAPSRQSLRKDLAPFPPMEHPPIFSPTHSCEEAKPKRPRSILSKFNEGVPLCGEGGRPSLDKTLSSCGSKAQWSHGTSTHPHFSTGTVRHLPEYESQLSR